MNKKHFFYCIYFGLVRVKYYEPLYAVIFNAFIVPFLIPSALKGVDNKPIGALALHSLPQTVAKAK